MNCFYKTFLILLRSRPINRQTEKNMPTLLSTWRLINSDFNVLISIELWETAACGKGPICIVCLMVLSKLMLSQQKKSWHVLFKVHIYENLLASGCLKAIFL